MTPSVGIIGYGTFFPQHLETAADIAQLSGIRQHHRAGEADTVTAMAT